MTDGSLKLKVTERNLAVVDRDHLHLSLAPKRDRLLPVDNLQGFVGRVEEERLLHSGMMRCPASLLSSGPVTITANERSRLRR